MQVQCSECSQPIALSDTIESDNGRLSHVDCQRPRVLTPAERALVFVYCTGHVVARCPACDISLRSTELGADILGGSCTNMCPRCRRDLTEVVRAHLFRCAMLPSETRLRAKAVREAAQHLVKESQQLRDTSDVLIREAEAALFKSQCALREAMSRRTTSSLRTRAAIHGERTAILHGIHVLVIHDDQAARHYLRSVLEVSGAIVTAAAAADALRAALVGDVLVCDLESADKAGSEFLSQLQSLHVKRGRSVPTIALVRNGTRRARQRASFVGFLMKPVDGDELRATVLEAASL